MDVAIPIRPYLLAVQRGEEVITNAAAETIIRAEDRLVVPA
jgi:hypothetical protein